MEADFVSEVGEGSGMGRILNSGDQALDFGKSVDGDGGLFDEDVEAGEFLDGVTNKNQTNDEAADVVKAGVGGDDKKDKQAEAEGGGQFDGRVDEFAGLGAFHVVMDNLALVGAEFIELGALQAEGFDGADAGEGFEEEIGLADDSLEAGLRGATHFASETSDWEYRKREEEEADGGEEGVDPEKHGGDAKDGDGFFDEIGKAAAGAGFDRLGVAVNAGHKVAGFGFVEEIVGEGSEFGEDVAAEVAGGAFAYPAHGVVAEVAGQGADGDESREKEDASDDLGKGEGLTHERKEGIGDVGKGEVEGFEQARGVLGEPAISDELLGRLSAEAVDDEFGCPDEDPVDQAEDQAANNAEEEPGPVGAQVGPDETSDVGQVAHRERWCPAGWCTLEDLNL